MDALDPTQDPLITENEDGSADVDMSPDMDEVEEMPDGSAVVTMENDGPEENPDFYGNMAETYSEYELGHLAIRYVGLLEKDKDARASRDKQYEEGIKRTGMGNDAPEVRPLWVPARWFTLLWLKAVLTLRPKQSRKCFHLMALSVLRC